LLSRRHKGAIAIVLAAASAGLHSVSAPAVQASPEIRVARSTNVISGSRTGYTLVRIPGRASIETPFGESSDVSVKGKGDFVGFALVAADPQGGVHLDDGYPAGVVGGRLPGSKDIDFVVPIGGAQYDFVKYYEDRVTFAPGLYRLYLLTSEGPATVAVHLDGLGGRAAFGVRTPTPLDVARPSSPVVADTTYNVYSGGAHRSVESAGFMFQGFWLGTNPHATGQYGFCYYANTPPPEPAAYTPGCPADDYAVTNDRNFMIEEDTKLYLEAVPFSGAGTFAQGFWYATQSVVTDMANVALWLQFDGT
jgi:hypothetical protein